MDRRRHRVPVRRLVPFCLLTAALLAGPTAPQAGIRDLAKSAKDKAAKATRQRPAEAPGHAGETVAFDETTLELTGALIDKLVAARNASASTASGRPALVKRRDANRTEAGALKDKHGGEIWDNANSRANAQGCIDGALQDMQRQKQEAEMKKMMADPRSSEKILKLTAAMNDAQLKGDQAEVTRLHKQLTDLYGATHADSVAAEKKCGGMPPLHPAAARIAVLDDEVTTIDEKIRDMDKKALKIQTDAAGLNERQLMMCWERVEMYLAQCGTNPAPRGFSPIELKALSENQSALKAALAG